MLNECPAFCQKAAEAYNNSSAWKKSNKRLLFLNASREETIRAYQEADIFLFPSRVECSPVVLFEALASRTPFLATDVGNAAEIAQWSGGGRILPTDIDTKGYAHADIVASAKMLTSLLQDKNAREMLATKGHAAWRSRFTWGKIADQYEEMFRDLVEKKGN
jgi:glycosyltransferase involved in cell wall biosynthesis